MAAPDIDTPEDMTDEEVCTMAFTLALEKGMEMCGETGRQMKAAAPVMGVPTDGDGEPDADCEAALEEGLNAETLDSFRGERQWVLCRVFNAVETRPALIEKHDGDFQAAVQEAWDMVDAAEDERGD